MTITGLVISDPHANIHALEAVLKDALKYDPFDIRLCSGDMVGYGGNPNETIERLRDEGFECVLGNHDVEILKPQSTGITKSFVREALDINRHLLEPVNKEWLASLLSTPRTFFDGRVAMVHASFEGEGDGDGHVWRYVSDVPTARKSMRSMPENAVVGFHGHTHRPLFVSAYHSRIARIAQRLKYETPRRGATHSFDFNVPGKHYLSRVKVLVNPGSVGQPRNHDNRAQYCTFRLDDTRVEVTYHRVDYDIQAAQTAILDAGIPEIVARRLSNGT